MSCHVPLDSQAESLQQHDSQGCQLLHLRCLQYHSYTVTCPGMPIARFKLTEWKNALHVQALHQHESFMNMRWNVVPHTNLHGIMLSTEEAIGRRQSLCSFS
jgi:hypothetical protein